MKITSSLVIFVLTLMLVTVSLVMVYSSSAAIAAREENRVYNEQTGAAFALAAGGTGNVAVEQATSLSNHDFRYLRNQLVFVLIAGTIMMTFMRMDYEFFRRFGKVALILSVLALIAVLIPGIGKSVNGARRWIPLGPLNLQPSEFAKLGIVLFLAHWLSENQHVIRTFFRGFLPPALLTAFVMGLIVVEPDLGSTTVLGLIAYSMWWVSGMRIPHLTFMFIAAVPAFIAAIIAEPFRVKRIFAFLDPEANRHETGWQLYQSLISVGSGGITGVGLGQGPQKYQFLSEGYTDFIYANICEEMGLIGGCGVAFVYVMFAIVGYRIASKAPDMFGCLLATGLTSMVCIPAFINMFVVTGLVPTKGLTLPLVSYGGSSLLVTMTAIGILMSIARSSEVASMPSRKLRPALITG